RSRPSQQPSPSKGVDVEVVSGPTYNLGVQPGREALDWLLSGLKTYTITPFCSSLSAHTVGNPVQCCFSFSTVKIPARMIVKVEKTPSDCPLPGYVVYQGWKYTGVLLVLQSHQRPHNHARRGLLTTVVCEVVLTPLFRDALGANLTVTEKVASRTTVETETSAKSTKPLPRRQMGRVYLHGFSGGVLGSSAGNQVSMWLMGMGHRIPSRSRASSLH
ncbi:hypothetical protein NFI96_007869, partial [Prochilodus magdalenae]